MKRVMGLALALIGAMQVAPANAGIGESLEPDALFLQAGAGEDRTESYLAGAVWEWPWHYQFKAGTVTGFFEAAAGRWSTHAGVHPGSAWVTQVGLTPVVRLAPAALGGNWFTELGVGANVILPIYRNTDKTFSTTFNFGDHVAVGRYFGAHQQHELAVRAEHFSNAGIDHPNPGENFVQVRYTHHL